MILILYMFFLSFVDIKKVIDRYGVIGVSAGSLFVFKGKYRAVLINYTPYNSLFNL